ncbi:phosphomannose isomerase GDP mannose pyrophosphorylase [Legionella birminghamensis]|uniref:Phosphomannose isomerase GDP mannose pyrophosphorylase n=1 Tax=Legionella birminghamensis TaxID=28083 RepID=A0A378I820_9GAMM|nr:hypothetical protein [Legionella birminghamensis]KTC76067.1 phosphomannose isomerase GDP mannose pyrophosphorylase [Legionella birminghamensis]STX30771.1 phosphomannose isomerase GDP mannose pyrophosphorylase [Legionella birminghamensis]
MKLYKKLLACFTDSKKESKTKGKFILYKIVDYDEDNYLIQCINTRGIIPMSLEEILCDVVILFGLHPIQSCFVGIEYIRTNLTHPFLKITQKNCISSYQNSRYGKYNLLFQNRDGLVGFECKTTDEIYIREPSEIALAKKIIEEFDAIQAFYIGVMAGRQFAKNPNTQRETNKKKHLRLVVG